MQVEATYIQQLTDEGNFVYIPWLVVDGKQTGIAGHLEPIVCVETALEIAEDAKKRLLNSVLTKALKAASK